MKAAVQKEFGNPDHIKVEKVEKPIPKENEVLVRIEAASVNSWDVDLIYGKPYIYRLLYGIFKPRHPIIGSDIAGIVESVGKEVKVLKPGDKVFGDISGIGFKAFAEYAAVPEELLAIKSEMLNFEQAASIPQAGLLALQGLFLNGEIKKGQKVLINGAGGGVGTFAIQIAKSYGAEVTAVDTSEKFEMMNSLGADYVIDYKKDDFTKLDKKYDLILDNVFDRNAKDCKKVLNENGNYVLTGGEPSAYAKVALFHQWRKKGKRVKLLLHKPNKNDLERFNKLVEEKGIRPVIDNIYKLEQLPIAIKRLAEGKVIGKAIIKMKED